ncbi:SEFIR domain-containing protein [Nitrosomonas oligotropha]|uniref:SEFIR domain-containing protein n=1 Tax=Nitrosomonas oligotropha TaxID=42354 RepID=A0A2T5I188_9PROT|nr:TIR domain-containing protein [Nitrosomonas oligotropha]PTQ77600.1 SEFIR domain-containing protein [Nitrosomonas oligotropha]
MIKVFISYSHDNDEHCERVRGLDASLSRDGSDCRLDVHKDTDEDWPSWMTNQLIEADFILCVITEIYEYRFRDNELPDQGLGVGWEAGLIRRLLYAKKLRNDRIFPVFFNIPDRNHIPLELQGYDSFLLDGLAGYEVLLRKLLSKQLYSKPAIGTPPDLETRATVPLFARPDKVSSPTDDAPKVNISHILRYAPAQLIGREQEIARLNDAWGRVMREETSRTRIITFVALGGEGKTSLIAKWVVDEMLDKGWRDCNAAFAWSFYNQGTREQLAASSDLFLKEALNFFGDDEDKDFASSPAGAYEKGQRLARIVGQRRNLLILDGLEPLQYAPAGSMRGELKDQGIAVLLKNLAQNSQGLCVATTRYSLPDLKAFWRTTAPEIKLERLSRDAGVHLLRTFDVHGAVQEFDALVKDVKGHALTLTLLGAYLRDAHNGDIRKRDLVKLEEADSEEQGGHAFRVMNAYAQALDNEGSKGTQALAILRLLGLFDRPATVECLDALWNGEAIPDLTEPLIGLSEAQRNIILKRLEDSRLLTVNRDVSGMLVSLDAHPLLREYFAKRLREQCFDAWRAAHWRLHKYLAAATPDKPRPTLEDLQPLYQAVFHGCQAGMQQEAYDLHRFRVKRDESYSCNKLGAFGTDLGAIACFFDQPWSRISANVQKPIQAILLNDTAFRLRALGRLTEALEPMQNGLRFAVDLIDWSKDSARYWSTESAKYACNLSDVKLTLGVVTEALKDAQDSLIYANQSGDFELKMAALSSYGHALHQAGNKVQAETSFREVEQGLKQMQQRLPAGYLFLLSIYDFHYCDLLLAASESVAWKITYSGDLHLPKNNVADHRVTLQAIYQRVRKIFDQNISRTSHLDTALDHLAFGRVVLYKAILANAKHGMPDTKYEVSRRELDSAVDYFRRSGNLDVLPLCLLSRAWLQFLEGKYTGTGSAQADLDEAWEIAERGPMKLHMADIHLYRARLFGNQQFKVSGLKYPWESPGADLEAAEKLINTCGYHRRDEELADAKRALLD